MFIPAHDCHHRSAIKAVSWRALGSLDTFVLSYFITGSFVFAGSIASAETFTKVFLYYLHERAWSSLSWGYRTKPQTGQPRSPGHEGQRQARRPAQEFSLWLHRSPGLANLLRQRPSWCVLLPWSHRATCEIGLCRPPYPNGHQARSCAVK